MKLLLSWPVLRFSSLLSRAIDMAVHTSLQVKAFDTLLVVAAFVFNTAILSPDVEAFVVASAGSFAGAISLVYYRREASRFEIFLKLVIATLGGFVLGSVAREYFLITNTSYLLGLFFLCGMTAVAICRAVLNTTERNAAAICRDALQRIFNLQTHEERKRPRGPRVKDPRVSSPHVSKGLIDTQDDPDR
jgi:hypothetical protein